MVGLSLPARFYELFPYVSGVLVAWVLGGGAFLMVSVFVIFPMWR